MNSNNNIRHAFIIKKKEILNSISKKLKSEFIGLNAIIDEVISLISPWFFFPEAQIRPTIINLWGLTGTGKTALVKRLVDLLEIKDNFLYLDMGEFSGESGTWIKSMLTDDLEHFHDKPCILCLDEFQFARTLSNSEEELSRDKMRILWEIFDSGKIYYEPRGWNYYVKRADIAIQHINKCLKKEVVLKNGEITENLTEFITVFKGYYFESGENASQEISSTYFLSNDFVEGVKELFEFWNYTEVEVHNLIKQFSLQEMAEWLALGIKKGLTIKQLDLSKSLIFILGNLDEAFYMSDELSPDLSADEFHSETLKINIADIKSALKKRFRNEQIARLGNNHLIYPCFNNEGYYIFIERNLNNIAEYIRNQFDISVNFGKTVVKAVYDEGVFPSQGVRPVLTTIKQMVESHIGMVICYILEQNFQVHDIEWEFHDKRHHISFIDIDGKHLGQLDLFPKLKLGELRKPDNDDVQMHIAVHESGHAVIAALVLRILPSVVVTKTVSSTCDGFCKINLPEKLSTKGVIRKRIMVALAGFLAEKLVFGEDNTSMGVSNDIERATELANQAIKEYAMGTDPIRIHVEAVDYNDFFFNKEKYANEAMKLIEDCITETNSILERNKLLLLKMAQYLTEHSVIREQAIGEMIKYYGAEPWLKSSDFITKDKYYSFKDIVKQQIDELENNINPVLEKMPKKTELVKI